MEESNGQETFQAGRSRELELGSRPSRGRIIRVITTRMPFKGYTVHASKDDPQYEIQSDKTDHIAMHKGAALRKLAG